jgi:AcrR family transcriptional regulator
MKRKYEMKQRARSQAETRQRIVEAAVELHTTIGPESTTISAIADRAGVQRHTVYAHFPDDRTLYAACSAHWRAAHPLPDIGRWLELDSPDQRLRGVLSAIYAWYDGVEAELAVLRRDSGTIPARTEQLGETAAVLRDLGDALARGRPRRKTVRAAIGHAIEFETWRSLVRRQGLTRAQAVEMMAVAVENA